MTYKETAEKALQQSGVAHAQLRAHYVSALESAGVLKEDETVAQADAWDEGAMHSTSDTNYTKMFDLPENPYRTETQ